ncbi:MAG: tetratricopeptide repeat family protein [uncultured bacterium]|nr:MAG: tetratricopeptide repeat family protein [uncultured bacterium]OGT59357.1 MAG: hypothetical protein A3F43_06465 [Gammaproteobacteria bacterium RIFCSPHIGHO2_12_FULL_42_10]
MNETFQLATHYMATRDFEQAIMHFSTIEKVYPDHVETLINLGTCYLESGIPFQAKAYYLKALALIPNEIQVLFNLGVLSVKEGCARDAIEFYLAILNIHPTHHATHHNLGALYFSLKKSDAALYHLQMACKIKPDDASARQMIAMLSNPMEVLAPSTPYLRTLFDNYADHYDAHLKSLDYVVPQTLLQTVLGYVGKTAHLQAALDVGAGTGLCGELFRPFVQQLIGVDLSLQMLKIAEQKYIYDELHEADFLEYLKDKNAIFDLIISGDVFVYCGDLMQSIMLTTKALKPNGLLVFNVEVNREDNVIATTSGRFKHHERYIEELLAVCSLVCIERHKTTLRLQDGVPVAGLVYLCLRIYVD